MNGLGWVGMGHESFELLYLLLGQVQTVLGRPRSLKETAEMASEAFTSHKNGGQHRLCRGQKFDHLDLLMEDFEQIGIEVGNQRQWWVEQVGFIHQGVTG